MCTVFDVSSWNIDEFVSIKSSVNLFIFGDFKPYLRDWLTFSGETNDLVNSVNSFSNHLTQMVNFSTRTPGCNSDSPALLYLCISSDPSICFTVAFRPFGNSGLSFHWLSNLKVVSTIFCHFYFLIATENSVILKIFKFLYCPLHLFLYNAIECYAIEDVL